MFEGMFMVSVYFVVFVCVCVSVCRGVWCVYGGVMELL